MKFLTFKKLCNMVKPGMFLRTDEGISVTTGGQMLDALNSAVTTLKTIEIHSKALDNGLRNCLSNARRRNDGYDIGYLEAMLKDTREIRDSARLLNPSGGKKRNSKEVILSEMDLYIIDDALECMEMHGMHDLRSYKTLKIWHKDQHDKIVGKNND